MKKEIESNGLTYRNIFFLWLPLAVMWIIMGIEQPLINGVIARLDAVKVNLAAFGVTYALALIIEGPVIQLLTAGTALSYNMHNYRKLLHFMHWLAAGLTALHLLLGLTPLYGLLLRNVMGIPDVIIGKSRIAFLIMTPWTGAIGYRRLWQGVLIRYKRTKAITVTMVIRLGLIVAVLALGLATRAFSGAEIGAMALSVGVIGGALASYAFVRRVVQQEIPRDAPDSDKFGWRRLGRFYLPLALTSFITLAARPVLTAGLGRAPYPLESLAAWPVINSLLFLFQSVALSYQEVVVSLYDSESAFRRLKTFTYYLAAGIGGMFLLVSLTPLNKLWYTYVAGLETDLLGFTRVPTVILTALPVASSFISWFRGVHVAYHRTKTITKAVVINSITLAVIMLGGARFFPWPGVVTAAAAFTGALIAESLYLSLKTRSHRRSSGTGG